MMEREKNDILYLVVPCYNEQEVLPETSKRLKERWKVSWNLESDFQRQPDYVCK